MALSSELLEILACPQCKKPVELSGDEKWLLCRHCRLQYQVKDDIPIMLVDEAKPLEE